jgi:hypothetical protein
LSLASTSNSIFEEIKFEAPTPRPSSGT